MIYVFFWFVIMYVYIYFYIYILCNSIFTCVKYSIAKQAADLNHWHCCWGISNSVEQATCHMLSWKCVPSVAAQMQPASGWFPPPCPQPRHRSMWHVLCCVLTCSSCCSLAALPWLFSRALQSTWALHTHTKFVLQLPAARHIAVPHPFLPTEERHW